MVRANTPMGEVSLFFLSISAFSRYPPTMHGLQCPKRLRQLVMKWIKNLVNWTGSMESPWPCLLAGLQRDFLNLIFMETNTACTTDPFYCCTSRNATTQNPGKWTTFIFRGRNNSGIKISGPLVHLPHGVGERGASGNYLMERRCMMLGQRCVEKLIDG